MKTRIIALDVEGTLVSLQGGMIHARPGLYDFLQFCFQNFERVVLYTLLSRRDAQQVAGFLVEHGLAPTELIRLFEAVDRAGAQFKDLDRVAGACAEEVLLVDDREGGVDPRQKDRWIKIEPYSPQWEMTGDFMDGQGHDQELLRVQEVLRQRLRDEVEPQT